VLSDPGFDFRENLEIWKIATPLYTFFNRQNGAKTVAMGWKLPIEGKSRII
jgi:hypothetical protein